MKFDLNDIVTEELIYNNKKYFRVSWKNDEGKIINENHHWTNDPEISEILEGIYIQQKSRRFKLKTIIN